MGYSVFITIVAIILFLMGITMFVKGKFYYKILTKLGYNANKRDINWEIFSWENCLNKLNIKADIVFFGDSITRGSDFGKYFNKKIVNLGLSGDSLEGMIKRISMIKAVSPEKLFVLGGINGLKNHTLQKSEESYNKLLKTLRYEFPETELFVFSVLPVSKKIEEEKNCSNITINIFNEKIEILCEKYNAKYIDIHKCFLQDGKMNSKFTIDGLHINEKGYDVWADAIKEYI